MKIFNWFNKQKKPQSVDAATYKMMLEGRSQGLMALWAAERMGKTSEAAANYADEIVSESMDTTAFINKVNEDLVFQEQHVDLQELHERLEGFKVVAKLGYEDEEKMANGGCE